MKKNEVLASAYELLKDSLVPDYEDSAKRLLAHTLSIGFDELIRVENISDEDYTKYWQLIIKRSKHVPLDKLIGYKYFFDVKIPFNKNTLTPRYETEFLVERVAMDIKNLYSQVRLNLPFKPITVLDLCTGSGCIGLALGNMTGANITMSDIDKKAIKIAQSNSDLNNKQRQKNMEPAINPNFVISDMFKNIKCKYDIIVCNPPYIKTQDLNKLEIEVRDFDPSLALDGGKDGLSFYRIIANNAHKYLNGNGKLYLEIGVGQSEQVCKMLNKNFDSIQVIKDLAGIDRFVIAKKREKYVK